MQCFRYDYLKRLSHAWTPSTASWNEDSGCAGNPTVTGLTGPSPYWHSYTYDKTGNRLTETQHAAAGDTDRTYTYPNAGASRPHSLSSVTTATGQGTTLDTFGYDLAGNTTSRSLAGEDEVLRWDAEGHLASVTKDMQVTSFVYDTAGQRLIRKDPTSVTLYLGKQEFKLTRATNAVSATRYYTAGGDGPTIALRQGATLTWLASDHQATSQVSMNSSTLEVTRRRQYPFGAPRAQQVSWPGDRGFVGGVRDASTGLTHLGAREYDPTLGRFLSVDPIMNLTDPQQVHGYSYSNNSPVTHSDPTGLYCDSCNFYADNKGGPEVGVGCPPCLSVEAQAKEDEADDIRNGRNTDPAKQPTFGDRRLPTFESLKQRFPRYINEGTYAEALSDWAKGICRRAISEDEAFCGIANAYGMLEVDPRTKMIAGLITIGVVLAPVVAECLASVLCVRNSSMRLGWPHRSRIRSEMRMSDSPFDLATRYQKHRGLKSFGITYLRESCETEHGNGS